MSARIETLKPARPKARKLDLAPVVDALRYSREVAHNIRLAGKAADVPLAPVIAEALDSIVISLFPTHLGPHGLNPEGIDIFVANTLSAALTRLGDQVVRSLRFDLQGLSAAEAQRRSEEILQGFAHQLPAIRALLVSDLKAALERDPSARSLAEVLICDANMRAMIHHRLAHALHGLGRASSPASSQPLHNRQPGSPLIQAPASAPAPSPAEGSFPAWIDRLSDLLTFSIRFVEFSERCLSESAHQRLSKGR